MTANDLVKLMPLQINVLRTQLVLVSRYINDGRQADAQAVITEICNDLGKLDKHVRSAYDQLPENSDR